MDRDSGLIAADPRWHGLYRSGAYASIAMLVIMVAQVVVFSVWPPPDSVEGFFTLFRDNGLLGLMSMDFLYLINNAVLILIYLALYAALRRQAESAMLVSLVMGLVGIAAYYASNTAFEMLAVSRQYWGAVNEVQRTALLAAGEVLLATYKGTAFDVYYVLNGAMLLILAVVMLRSQVFSKITGWFALAAAILMTVPSTAGPVGMVFALLSLVPWAVFLVLAARRLLKF